MGEINFVSILLYGLTFKQDAASVETCDTENWDPFNETYKSEERVSILEALNWAVENPDHDFQSMLPNVSLKNEEIYQFLCETLASHRDFVAKRDVAS